ncbi:MAG: replication-associated recombination protein A [Bacteroidales bacterium]|nr:replication-associated recombination protein A [Bacteroidales bacterium]MBQ1695627.1 replication-associated recombination protein A [Bacteroidales bacterium]MBQ2076855.1 replication-associated recombination protein A [Bacteroidales bacterium]MBQ2573822.1 replication-associated recombination protein A [Bacteroidales bacterium]MBQ5424362.1 replication-associated recombination protein A [Bacteroidales bacterium]
MLTSKPLAERMRPHSFDDYAGQQHLVGKNAPLRKSIEAGRIPSMILWGPPGVGKTTLVTVISQITERNFITLSAVSSGVKEVREVIEQAKKVNLFSKGNPILFIDEIHRFNKSQQDSLLGAVEDGTITLIGATTENPSFEVISPLLSRCQVYVLKHLDEHDLDKLIDKAITTDVELSKLNIKVEEREALYRFSGGDGRKLYNILELVCSGDDKEIVITNDLVLSRLQENMAFYDKSGEQHYDIISAFIKSVRGSDPDAAIYWLARMLEGGEDIKFIARRLIILASEDIGLANPNAMLIANACFDAIDKIGMPEARIPLAEATVYLATSPKSNSAYLAVDAAIAKVKETGDLPVPLHLRNAPTALMKKLNYGADYKYAHNFENHYVEQQYLPDKLVDAKFYEPAPNAKEEQIRKWMDFLKKK